MTCSRCGSTVPIPSCIVCWEEVEEDHRDFDEGVDPQNEHDAT